MQRQYDKQELVLRHDEEVLRLVYTPYICPDVDPVLLCLSNPCLDEGHCALHHFCRSPNSAFSAPADGLIFSFISHIIYAVQLGFFSPATKKVIEVQFHLPPKVQSFLPLCEIIST